MYRHRPSEDEPMWDGPPADMHPLRAPRRLSPPPPASGGGYGGGHYGYRGNARAYSGQRSSASEDLDQLLRCHALYSTAVPLQFHEFLQAVGSSTDPRYLADVYEKYRNDFDLHQCRAFYEAHHAEGWFKEKYDPVLSKEIKQQVQAIYQRNSVLFTEDLMKGRLEGISLTVQESTTGAAAAAVAEEEDNEDGEVAETKSMGNAEIDQTQFAPHPIYTALRTSMEGDTAELLRSRPALILIKSVPAHATRTQLEEVLLRDPDVAYVSFAQPNASKRFSRVAFIALKESATAATAGEGEGNNDDNFVQTVFERLNGTKLRLARPRRSSTTQSDEVHATNESGAVSTQASVTSLTAVDDSLPLQADPSATVSSSAVVEETWDEFELHMCLLNDEMRVKFAPDSASDEQALRYDYEQVRRLVVRWTTELGVVEDPFSVSQAQVNTETDLDEVVRCLDLNLIFLRRVFYYCYYCRKEPAESAEEFLRICGEHHVRRPAVSGGLAERRIEGWKAACKQHVDALIDGLDSRQIQKLHYKSPEESVELFIGTKIQFVAPQKYKCTVKECKKMFKGDDFVRKHIRNKHPQMISEHEQFAYTFSAYLRDPFRLGFRDMLPIYQRKQLDMALHANRPSRSDPPAFLMPIPDRFANVLRPLRSYYNHQGYGGGSGGTKRRREDSGNAEDPLMHRAFGKRSRVGYQDLDGDMKRDAAIEINYD